MLEECGHMRPLERPAEVTGGLEEMVEPMNTVYAREDYLGADEYIDVVNKSGLNRPVERPRAASSACWPMPT